MAKAVTVWLLTLLGTVVLSGCNAQYTRFSPDLGAFTQQELNEARRIRHNVTYWFAAP